MLSVIILNVVMLSVVAPLTESGDFSLLVHCQPTFSHGRIQVVNEVLEGADGSLDVSGKVPGLGKQEQSIPKPLNRKQGILVRGKVQYS
jgi:hypothetical protein